MLDVGHATTHENTNKHIVASYDPRVAVPEPELVENDALVEPTADSSAPLAFEEVETRAERPPAPTAHPLALSDESIVRGIAVREAFATGGAESGVAERLLEEFVGGEVPVVHELQKVEAALVALLGKAIQVNPVLALRVAEVLRETAAVSASVRNRIEKSLAAATSLRAQKTFLAAHQRGNGGPRGV